MEDRKYEKRKISLDIKEECIEVIEQFMAEASFDVTYVSRMTTTAIINNCVMVALGRSRAYRESLAKFALDEINKYEPKNISECQREKDIVNYRRVYNFLTHERGLSKTENTQNLIRYDFSDGYVIVPDDWIFLNPEKVSEAEYCFPLIIEVRNGEKYRIPYFFFLSTSEKLTYEDKEKYLNIAFTKCDALNAAKNLIAYPIVSKEGENLNHEICLAAPEPKFFSFPKFGDRYSSSVFGELWVTKGRIELMKKYGESK